jgi:hypothetical protein
MFRNELPIGVRIIGTPGTLPILVFTKLRDPRASLRGELTFRVTLNEMTVRLDRVSGLSRAPILLLATATRDQQQQ